MNDVPKPFVYKLLHLFLLVESEIERKVLMNYTQEREGIDTKKQNSFTIFVPDE